MARNSPPTTMKVFINSSVIVSAETYSTQTINGQVVTPYIYSYSMTPDALPRSNHGFIEHEGSFYVFGGLTMSMARYLNPSASSVSNEVLRYNGIWTSLITNNTPIARYGAAFVKYTYTSNPSNGLSTGTYAFLLFGHNTVVNIDSLHSFNFSTLTWTIHTTIADPINGKPAPRHLFMYIIYQGSLFIFGGIGANDSWRLDLNTFQWVYLTANTDLARHSAGITLYNGLIIISGGEANSTLLGTTVSFNPVTNQVKIENRNIKPNFMIIPSKLHQCFTLGINEVPAMFSLGGYANGFVNQGKVRLYRFNGKDWFLVNDTVLPFIRPDMNSVAGFGFYTSGVAISYIPGQTIYDYEVFIDDGLAGSGINYHSGLWRILIRYDSVTATWTYINSLRMPGKGVYLANTIPNQFIERNITVDLYNSSLRIATTNLSKSIMPESLIIRP